MTTSLGLEQAAAEMEVMERMRKRGMVVIVMLASNACKAVLRRAGIKFETKLGDVYIAKRDRVRADKALNKWEARR